MQITQHLARHFRQVHWGGNWTAVNLKDTLADVSWQEATCSGSHRNTIAELVFHIHYYVAAILKVMRGGPLDAKDAYSFDMPPIESGADWHQLQEQVWRDAEAFAAFVEQMPDSQLSETFADAKYGTWYRNLAGVIEHTHYHLGQIVTIKRVLRGRADQS